jgi:hypothetical protein
MNTVATTYFGFQDLPRNVKKMLLESERFFFDQDGMGSGHSGADAQMAPLTVVLAGERATPPSRVRISPP